MNEFTRTTEEMLKAAKEARIPEQVQTFAAESVDQTRKAYTAAASAAFEQARTAEQMFSAMQSGARAIGDKLIANTAANTEAFFDAASQMAKASTFPEVARLQAEFARDQLSKAANQTKELVELASEVTKSTFEEVQSAAGKAAQKARKFG